MLGAVVENRQFELTVLLGLGEAEHALEVGVGRELDRLASALVAPHHVLSLGPVGVGPLGHEACDADIDAAVRAAVRLLPSQVLPTDITLNGKDRTDGRRLSAPAHRLGRCWSA